MNQKNPHYVKLGNMGQRAAKRGMKLGSRGSETPTLELHDKTVDKAKRKLARRLGVVIHDIPFSELFDVIINEYLDETIQDLKAMDIHRAPRRQRPKRVKRDTYEKVKAAAQKHGLTQIQIIKACFKKLADS
jgi:hypothetical protein